jgi:uncharacterized membrane protein
MSSPASIGKHPIHPMLVVFPLGLLNFSTFADLLYVSGKGDPAWKEVSSRTMAGGIIAALAAAIPGFIDLLSLKGKARKVGLAHMALNLGVVGLFSYNLWRRIKSPEAPVSSNLSLAGTAGLIASGWLGGELVYVHKTGVEAPQERRREIEGEWQEKEYFEPT